MVLARFPARARVLLAALLLGLSACATFSEAAPGSQSSRPLGDRIDALLAEQPFDRVHWGVVVWDRRTGRPLYERNAALPFIPASNMKLPITVAAFGLMGPGFRWETSFFANSRPVDGVLEGDLYLAADGDPTLGAPFYESADVALGALADTLLAAGVRDVTGRLLVDVSAWDSTTVPESWMIEDLDGTAGATGGAFTIGQGELEILVRAADRPGEPATVSWAPGGSLSTDPPAAANEPETAAPPAFVEARAATVGPDESTELVARYLPESRRWTVEGRIAAGEQRSITRSARDPVRLAVSALIRALRESGVRVTGGAEIIWERDRQIERSCGSGRIPQCPEMLRLAGMASPSLSSVIAEILGPSQNWTAEQLVRSVGSEVGAAGSWPEGFEAVGNYLAEEAGIELADVQFEDGSGLSNHNLLSPRAVAAMLGHAARQPWGPAFIEALAEPGEEGTTLEGRLAGLEGRVYAKTGSLSHVNSLSGYVVGAGGRELVFSVLSNGANLPASQVRERIDLVVREMGLPLR